jgi:hypothetical protein
MPVYTYDSFTYALLFMPLKYTVEISVKVGCLWFTMGENILNLGIKLGGQNPSLAVSYCIPKRTLQRLV